VTTGRREATGDGGGGNENPSSFGPPRFCRAQRPTTQWPRNEYCTSMNQHSRIQNMLNTSNPSTSSSRAIGSRIRLSPFVRLEGGSRVAMPQITPWMLLPSTRCICPPHPRQRRQRRSWGSPSDKHPQLADFSSGYPIVLYTLVLTISLLSPISDSDSPPLLSSTWILRFTYGRPVLRSSPPDSSRTERKGSRRFSRVQSAYVHSHFQASRLPFRNCRAPRLAHCRPPPIQAGP
jgi:hypothetical protein